MSHLSPAGDYRRGQTSTAFVYTDRSVYRPLQTLYWKVVPFRGGGEEHRWETLPLVETQVVLVDANGDEVARQTVTTNEFGSASGAFDIPAGRLLGQWRLRSTLGDASTTVRVEEYKRPTFEVEVSEPEAALRLNRPAELRGTVGYYFGLPVAEGDVSWRVTREPVYPRWWFWWRSMTKDQSRVVAAGQEALDENGEFSIQFVPEADEREAERGVTYRFRLAVDVTAPSGETRSASRSFRLGFTAVEAAVDLGRGFVPAGTSAEAVITRKDLDGAPRAGQATWRVVRLDQPDRTLTPSRQPLPPADDPDAYVTEGDRSRTRWRPDYDPQQVMASWAEGRTVVDGVLEHGEDGIARVALDDLRPGPYRLVYSTEDSFGAAYENQTQFVVADAKSTRLSLPVFLGAEGSSVAVGETARFFVHSGFPGQAMVLEFYRDGHRFDRRVLRAGRDPQLVLIPVDDSLRGGFGASLTVLHDHQVVTETADVFVPWDDRELKLEFATFRDMLRPGTRETFRVTVRNPGGGAVDSEAAEVLAYMYDRSLDIFAAHNPPQVAQLYPTLTGSSSPRDDARRGFERVAGPVRFRMGAAASSHEW